MNNRLGGHLNITHLDKGALCFVVGKYNISTAYDVGCGPGGMLDVMKSIGIRCIGIDGDSNVNKSGIIVHDFYKGPLELDKVDLGWSVEFLEHVHEKYLSNVFSVFKKCKYVVCTAAPPGKSGHHHVNCRTVEYWIDVFYSYGFVFYGDMTNSIRYRSSMDREFMRNTGMFFVNGMI